MRYRLLIYLAILALPTSLVAQETLTLEQCKDLAAKNNLKAKQAQIEYMAAHEVKKEAFTKYFPNISASGSYFRTSTPLIDMDLEMPGLLPAPIPVSGIKDGYAGMVMAVQPVYAGGQIVNANKLAGVGMEVSALQQQKNGNDIALQTEQYFYNLITLHEKAKTLEMLDKQLISITLDVQNAYNAGLCNKTDLLNIQLKQNEIRNGMTKILHGQNILQLLLAQQIGIPADNFRIDTMIVYQHVAPENLFLDPKNAIDNRIEMKLLNKNVEAVALQKKMKVGSYLPTVGIGAAWIYDNMMEDFTNEKQSLGMLFATVKVPISDWWGASHAIRAQEAKIKIAGYQRQDGEEMLLIQIWKVYNELTEAYDQIAINKESVAVAEENFRLSNDYFSAGTLTLSDLLDAQTQLQKSRNSYTESLISYYAKLTEYKQVTGQE
ncbi:MAG: TolC family protein [Prevotellaceae bacterium]|nr:TolC family protein [Prevotellaceae bacterium]